MYRALGDAQRLPGTNLNGRAVNRPGKDTLCEPEASVNGFSQVLLCPQVVHRGLNRSMAEKQLSRAKAEETPWIYPA